MEKLRKLNTMECSKVDHSVPFLVFHTSEEIKNAFCLYCIILIVDTINKQNGLHAENDVKRQNYLTRDYLLVTVKRLNEKKKLHVCTEVNVATHTVQTHAML